MALREKEQNVKAVSIITDNDGCYENHVLPMLVPFMCERHSLQLNAL